MRLGLWVIRIHTWRPDSGPARATISKSAHHLGDVLDVWRRREAMADELAPLLEIGGFAKILGVIFQRLPLHEQPVALRHLVRALQGHEFAALGALENRRRLFHAG